MTYQKFKAFISAFLLLVLSVQISAKLPVSGFSREPINVFDMTLTPTPQTCTGNGEVTINITNTEAGAEFEFRIYQSSNLVTPIRVTNGITATGNTLNHIENALQAGSYRIIAVQTVGVESNQQTRDVTITDNIQSLAFTLNQAPLCSGASITVNVTSGNPATYELRNASTNAVVIPAQASNVLTPVPAGTYNVIVTDVCNNSSSLGVTVTEDPAVYTVRRNNGVLGFWTMEDCNTIRHLEQLQYNGGPAIPAARFPINVNIQIDNPTGGPATIINTVWNSSADNAQLVLVPFYEGQSYNYTVTFTDACGKVTTRTDVINAVPTTRLLQPVATCGTKFLSLDQFQYYLAPVQMTFTAYPAGFDPANYNPDFAPGTFTHTYNTLPGTVLFGNASSVGVPVGNYTLQITSCGRTETKTFNVLDNVNYSINLYRIYSGCGDNEGSINFYIRATANTQADDIQSVTFTSAPSAFVTNYGALPFDVSHNIASNGQFYMNSLPAGNYTAQVRGTCGIPITTSFTIYDKSITSTVTPTLNCGSFNVTASVTSYLGGEVMWLQKYYPASGRWGHPTTGVLYTEGSSVAAQNGMAISQGPSPSGYTTVTGTLNNIVSTGQFRVVVQYLVHGNGTATDLQCRETLSTFNVPPNGVVLNNYYVANCTSGNTELVIDANGVAPLNYTITAFNGTPMTVNNGTNPVFTQLQPGEYTVAVQDGCNNTSVFKFRTDVVKAPVIRPNNLCEGQTGSLFVTGLSFLNIEWTKGNDPTVIATGNTLNFNPFNEATHTGTYYAKLSYSPNPNACIAQTLSFTVVAPQPVPEAGTGQTVDVLQQNAGVINLFDYVTGPYDNFGDWTDLSNTGVLNNEVLDASTLPVGTYQFRYDVDGACSGTDATVVTLNIISSSLTAVTDNINNICAYNAQTNIGNVMDNDTESGPVVQANYSISIETADPNGILTVNPNGSIDLAEGAQPGQTYTLQYRITEIANINNFAVGTLNVNISSQATPGPVADATQELCRNSAAIVGNLVATGNNIKWYNIASGGTALAPTTLLVNGATYYATQTINGCESMSVPVVVNLKSCNALTNPSLRGRVAN